MVSLAPSRAHRRHIGHARQHLFASREAPPYRTGAREIRRTFDRCGSIGDRLRLPERCRGVPGAPDARDRSFAAVDASVPVKLPSPLSIRPAAHAVADTRRATPAPPRRTPATAGGTARPAAP